MELPDEPTWSRCCTGYRSSPGCTSRSSRAWPPLARTAATARATPWWAAGDEGNELLVVIRGELAVWGDGLDGEEVIARIGPAECAGEMALLLDEPRSATITCLRRAEVLVLGKDVFRELVRYMMCGCPGLDLSGPVAAGRGLRGIGDRRLEPARSPGSPPSETPLVPASWPRPWRPC